MNPTDDAAGPARPTDEVEKVLVFPSSGRLHLPDDDGGPLCSSSRSQCREKPLGVYPEAHRQWCAFCLDVFGERKALGYYS